MPRKGKDSRVIHPKLDCCKKMNNRELLASIVSQVIEADPYEHRGLIWCARPYNWLTSTSGLGEKTIRTYVSLPPFMRIVKHVESVRTLLVRVVLPNDPVVLEAPEDIAQDMAKVWRKATGKATTHHEFGMLVGLAKAWPAGHQVAIFKCILNRWSTFMAGAGLEMALLEQDGQGQKKFYKFPSISVMLRFNAQGYETYKGFQEGWLE